MIADELDPDAVPSGRVPGVCAAKFCIEDRIFPTTGLCAVHTLQIDSFAAYLECADAYDGRGEWRRRYGTFDRDRLRPDW